MPARRLPIQQLTVEEMERVDKILRREKKSAADAWRAVNEERAKTPRKERVAPLSKQAVHRYVNGESHVRGRSETRGRKRKLRKVDELRLDQARRRLIKQADGEYRVTHDDVMEEASKTALNSNPCQRVCADSLRTQNVKFRAPRKKIFLTEKDAKKRMEVGKEWIKHPPSFWKRNLGDF